MTKHQETTYHVTVRASRDGREDLRLVAAAEADDGAGDFLTGKTRDEAIASTRDLAFSWVAQAEDDFWTTDLEIAIWPTSTTVTFINTEWDADGEQCEVCWIVTEDEEVDA